LFLFLFPKPDIFGASTVKKRPVKSIVNNNLAVLLLSKYLSFVSQVQISIWSTYKMCICILLLLLLEQLLFRKVLYRMNRAFKFEETASVGQFCLEIWRKRKQNV